MLLDDVPLVVWFELSTLAGVLGDVSVFKGDMKLDALLLALRMLF